MTNETKTEEADIKDITLDEYEALLEGIGEGLDRLVNITPKQVRYVCVTLAEKHEILSLVTNAPPELVLEMLKSTVKQAEKDMDNLAEKHKSSIILTH